MNRITVLALVFGGAWCAASDLESSPHERLSSLRLELENIEHEMTEVYADLQSKSKDLEAVRREYQYKDEAIAEIWQQIRALESELIELRSHLEVRMKAVPEISAAVNARKAVFETIRALKSEKDAVLQEIELLEGTVYSE